MNILIGIIVTHLIGALISLLICYKLGVFKEAALYGDGFRTCTPADVVYITLLVWEIYLIIKIFEFMEYCINQYFYNKYKDEI